MSLLTVHRAKPNPLGKDTAYGQARPEQLLGEWADLINNDQTSVGLGFFGLAHQQFSERCVPGDSEMYWEGDAAITLKPGEIVRVHTGHRSDLRLMKSEDWNGAHHHAFADKGGFVLNNKCGDLVSACSLNNGKWVIRDQASYDAKPPEGVVLERSGDKLVPGVAARFGFAGRY